MKILIFMFALLFCSQTLKADTSSVSYFPLKVGNVWIYNWLYFGNPSMGGLVKVQVVKDSLINSKKYFLCDFPGLPQWLRVDSISGNIYSYSFNGGCIYNMGETLIDSLNSKKFDSTDYCNDVKRLCTDTGTVNLFGNQYSKKEFGPVFILSASERKYAKGIGNYFSSYGDPFPTDYTLTGCVLDGIVYGDTTLTSVYQISSAIPEVFSLLQNYPNPFNPRTIIKYELGITNIIKLKVFDVLGNEVATLVNEKQSAGTYSVDFDGRGFASGVYFYKLEAGEFVETKRMILLK